MAISSVITSRLAKICQYLVGNNASRQSILMNGSLNQPTAKILYMERKAIEYGISQNLSSLQGKTNYLYSLLGGSINTANNILTNGGGGINVGAVQNSNGGLTPYPINLSISSGQAGVSTISSTSWVGLAYINSVVINSSVYQEGIGFTFNSATGVFDFSLSGYVLQEGDDFSTLGFQPITSSGGGGGVTSPQTATGYASGETTTINIAITIDKTVNLAFRGGTNVVLIFTGTPTGNQILFDSVTGDFYSAGSNPFADGEALTVQYY